MKKIVVIFLLLLQCSNVVLAGPKNKGGVQHLINMVVDIVVTEENNDGGSFVNKKEGSNGTGFIIDEKGIVVTNSHVIDGADKIKVITYDGSEYVANIIGKDERSDIALLKIDTDIKLPYVEFADSDKVEICDKVIAIGNPFGFGKTVTSGIISYKGRNLSDQIAELGTGGDLVSYLQTDAFVNYGNSGGPLFLENGKVVGMITVFLSDGVNSTGINFAIPSNTLKKIIKQLREHGRIEHSWIGISVRPLDKGVAIALGLGKRIGYEITRVAKNSPAATSMIQVGDILLSLNDEAFKENSNVEYMLNNLPIGKVIPIQIMKLGVEQKLSVKVEKLQDDASSVCDDVELLRQSFPYEMIDSIKVGVSDINSDLRKSFDLSDDVKSGVVITYVSDDSDIALGSVIKMINQREVKTVKELKDVLEDISKSEFIKTRKQVALYVYDSQSRRSTHVSLPFHYLKKTVSNVAR